VTTRILEWYGMLKQNEKSSPMTNGIRATFKCGNYRSVSSPPTPLSSEELMGRVDEDVNNSSGGECKDPT
jgi:hypothetical protein